MTNKNKEKMQIGRRIAYLKRCMQAAELINTYESATTVRRRVFINHIQPVLGCSYTAFNSMLNVVNPAREIAELEAKLLTL